MLFYKVPLRLENAPVGKHPILTFDWSTNELVNFRANHWHLFVEIKFGLAFLSAYHLIPSILVFQSMNKWVQAMPFDLG